MVDEFIAERDCPRDCPFLNRIAGGAGARVCTFALYADILEPNRHTRTEIHEDGTIDYNIPPNCNVYEKYKDKKSEIAKMKRKYKSKGAVRTRRKAEAELVVTAHKHAAISRHHRH